MSMPPSASEADSFSFEAADRKGGVLSPLKAHQRVLRRFHPSSGAQDKHEDVLANHELFLLCAVRRKSQSPSY